LRHFLPLDQTSAENFRPIQEDLSREATGSQTQSVEDDVTIDDRALTLRARGTGRPVTAAESFDEVIEFGDATAATVTLTLTEGHPTKGKLILATYVPQ
jgi:hypothetical protein